LTAVLEKGIQMTEIQTTTGTVRGVVDDGLARFLGIPYAAAPYGANRFRFPQPVEPWDGVRDALVHGTGVPQPRTVGDPMWAYTNPVEQGEDCLNLNVWSPDTDTAAPGLPVMVWIHGGGFMSGGTTGPQYEGRTFARDGVVHVGITYRLGIDGFTYFGEGTDNLGLRDQVAALEWVRDNIAAFGGDPENVTIFGESGGAVSVLDLMAMPSARGLFHRAIAQSGSPAGAVAADDALEVTARIAERLGIEATPEAFAALSVEQTVAEVEGMVMDWLDLARWGSRTFMISPFRAVYGTESLPEPVLEGSHRSPVPLLTGTCVNEAIGFVQLLGLGTPEAAAVVLPLLGVDEPIVDAYRDGRGLTSPLELVEAAWTDWAFRMPTLSLVEARAESGSGAPTHLYEFHWESPAIPAGVGAHHAIELPFVYDGLEQMAAFDPAGRLQLGDNPPAALAATMHRAWIAFATTGDPGWPAHDLGTRATMVFDETSAVVDDVAAPERLAWNGRR
jgi:para-nitrobenzyl esterase